MIFNSSIPSNCLSFQHWQKWFDIRFLVFAILHLLICVFLESFSGITSWITKYLWFKVFERVQSHSRHLQFFYLSSFVTSGHLLPNFQSCNCKDFKINKKFRPRMIGYRFLKNVGLYYKIQVAVPPPSTTTIPT